MSETLTMMQTELIDYVNGNLAVGEPVPVGAVEQLLCEYKDGLTQIRALRAELAALRGSPDTAEGREQVGSATCVCGGQFGKHEKGCALEFSDAVSGRILDKAKMLIEIDSLREERDRLRAANERLLDLATQMAGKLRVVSEDGDFCHADYPGFAHACGQLVDQHRALATPATQTEGKAK